jgi:flavin-binding protein dodecin
MALADGAVSHSRACETLKNIEDAWVQDQQVVVKGGNIGG